MKLSKALKVKNRTVGEINKLRAIIQRENSTEKDSYSKVDVGATMAALATVLDKLVKIKTAIAQANTGIYEKICKMEEKKSQIAFLNSLNTTHGVVKNSYRDEADQVFEAHVKREDVDESVNQLQTQIDNLQDECDEYNATTSINFE